MNISKKIVNIIKIKLLSYKNIIIYTSFYREAYNNISNLVSKNSKIIILTTDIVLQKALLFNYFFLLNKFIKALITKKYLHIS